MCKPKNRVLCPDCGREKMLFENEKKANLFIKFNGQEISTDVNNLRVYYCPACCGYHISSHKYFGDNKNTERLIKQYNFDKHRDEEFFDLRDKCLSMSFKKKEDFLKFIKSQEVSNFKVIDRVISWFNINHKW